MRALTPTAVLLGLAASSPSLWAAFNGTGTVDSALVRFLVGTAAAAFALSLVRGLVGGYRRGAGRPANPGRRAADRTGGDPA
jgi:hypothetical protein